MSADSRLPVRPLSLVKDVRRRFFGSRAARPRDSDRRTSDHPYAFRPMRFLRRPAFVRCPGAPHRASVAFLFAFFFAMSAFAVCFVSFAADARAETLSNDVKHSNVSTVAPQFAPSVPSAPSTESASVSVSTSAPLAEDDPEPRPAVAALPRHVFSGYEEEPVDGRTGDTPTLVFGGRPWTNRGSGRSSFFPLSRRFDGHFPITRSNGAK